mmetsp:Transcript_68532/g.107867  ORF Transcript_68532/g.107867 Transcript_68532/m.107867 type:complete len:536 (+) Transcript_68532:53-1660(+)
MKAELSLFFDNLDATGLAGKKVMIIWEGTAGAGRQYMAAASSLQKMGLTISLVGPPDVHVYAKHFELAYVCTSPSTHELLSRPSVVAATTANDYDLFEKAWALENEAYTAANIHVICQAIKGFEPDLILTSTRPLHRVLAVGNALAIPVLCLALQEPVDVLGDAFEPAWATMKASKLASLLSSELQQWGPNFEQALGISSPAAHFWPSVAQVKALAGKLPQFPYFTLCNFEQLDRKDLDFWSYVPDGFCEQPETLPYNLKKKKAKKLKPSNVFALGCFQWDIEEEAYMPALTDRVEAQKLEEFIVHARESTGLIADELIYVSFGPVICKDVKFMTSLVLRALKIANLKAIVDTSCGMSLEQIKGLGDEEALKEYCEKNVFFVHKVPAAKFLPRCSACLHDGNSAMIRHAMQANVPNIMVPIFGQQFQNAQRMICHDHCIRLDPMKGLVASSMACGLENFFKEKNHLQEIQQKVWIASERLSYVSKLAEHRLVHVLQKTWTETLKGEIFLKDMDDLQADDGGACRCCSVKGRRVQP